MRQQGLQPTSHSGASGGYFHYFDVLVFHIGFAFDVMPNHALQRTAASRLSFNPTASQPPSLSLGR